MAVPELHELIGADTLTKHLENMPFGMMLWDQHMKLVYCSKDAAATSP